MSRRPALEHPETGLGFVPYILVAVIVAAVVIVIILLRRKKKTK
ncbi:MAG: LPXTG cell wall anchor domain-containing protein [Euryarchaeota archaeon]|nr:LPXTG cell wall anchor domain-containing protein [Euryarchaeota archaeon]MBU4071853.1 LPXTG cell wall anchor domain-containing protein [Candidatus Thermoplasmatota archaeon]MBU4144734.1 LPXTG cell wall anchor domain-containing protein [Candidatus Thermoplasmatota archaeon]